MSVQAETLRPAYGRAAPHTSLAAALRGRIALWLRARRTARHLDGLSDAALRDLGLTRDQIGWISRYTAEHAARR